jgi:hypothetical protein
METKRKIDLDVTKESTKLKKCPFCGGRIVMTQIGNEYTRTVGIKTTCCRCRITKIDETLNKSFRRLVEKVIKSFNQRSYNGN